MQNCFFSVVVVCYNAEKYIVDTVNSILMQTYTNYEIIIKDGLSTDNTLSIIPNSQKIKLISKEDSGIYDAMNQAIELSSGKYIFFLNCGDLLENKNVLERIYETAKNYNDSIVYGDYTRKGIVFKQPKKMTELYIYKNHLCHQTMFIAKNLFNKHGLYEIEYSITADYEHALRNFFQKEKFVHCDIIVCDYRGDGISESDKGIVLKQKERKKIINKYFDNNKIRKYNFIISLSLVRLRRLLVSDKSPTWLRGFYRKFVNLINEC